MVKGRQTGQKALAAIAAATALVGIVAAGFGQRPQGTAQATLASASTATAQPSPYYSPKAGTLLNGVLAPLSSLRVMQRAIALAPEADVTTVPTLALLAAPLKTTGLGPIRIGMDLDELRAKGLTPVLIDEASNGQCQYYRIKDHGEPLGLMAINDQVLRVEVWPGSLTTTRSGIRIGSTERDLVRVYGQQLEATANPATLGKTVIFTPQDPGEDVYRLVFETDDQGRVTQFRAGQFPSVTWAEGCG
ncbi:hypothetical protein PGN35_004160 [Nodosilinea sp. PGN35]|uniref:hypothetical protein n=1 Tax=Nodosilinea sp. PGN35 TaxID=3020489 RepID=UPI0023B2BE77|nr:hypothetical protein [Nodosilinea sp. TSF1-S3]MDF0365814.1 hypothetical protein [Nodosilinea sp. TSF1-S3]